MRPLFGPRTVAEAAFLVAVPVIALEGGTLVANPGEVPTLIAEAGAGQSMTQAARDALRRVDSVLSENSDPLKKTIANLQVFSDGLARNTGKLDGIIAGLEKPDQGQVLADNQPVLQPGRHRLVMFQESALFPWLNVFGNVMFGLRLKPGLRNSERREVAKFFLHLVGLEKFMEANVHELSGGMKQRVALARALAPNPRVLLMDEPFAALDAMTREQLYGDIQRIWEKRRKTIIFVTHNVREAACLADRVMIMSPTPGRIREVFEVNLPRPRDFNSIEIAQHAAKLTTALKGYAEEEVTAVS